MTTTNRLESFGIYKLACQLFDDYWADSEILGKDYRGRELVKQQVRSLDSISANIEEGYGRGFGKELPYFLEDRARIGARKSRSLRTMPFFASAGADRETAGNAGSCDWRPDKYNLHN